MCGRHHHHCSEVNCGCNCGCSNCHCGQSHHEEECHHHHDHHHEKYSHQLLELADEAWTELLKEKIKQEILKNSGQKLDELAQLVSKTNHKRWASKMQAKECWEHFECEMHSIFKGDKCSSNSNKNDQCR